METKFNQYLFIQELEKEIIEEIKKGNIQSSDDYYTYMHQEIDMATIYSIDCFAICIALNATDFSEYESECNNIYDLARASLYEYTLNELDVNKLEELLDIINA